jgi:predicted RNA binding protein YcfA (HicA-like mRNA interferase family)
VKLPRVSSAHVISGLKKRGFTEARYQGKGSHTALIRIDNTTGQKLLVIVPKRDILPIGTLLSIMRQGEFTREEFMDILTG